MDVLVVVGAMALAAAIVILVDLVVLRRPVDGSDPLIQTLARAYRYFWRHGHKL